MCQSDTSHVELFGGYGNEILGEDRLALGRTCLHNVEEMRWPAVIGRAHP